MKNHQTEVTYVNEITNLHSNYLNDHVFAINLKKVKIILENNQT